MKRSLFFKLLIKFVMQWVLIFIALWLVSYLVNKSKLYILGSSFTAAGFFTSREFMKQPVMSKKCKYIIYWTWIFMSVLIGFLLTPMELNFLLFLALSGIIACIGIVLEWSHSNA